MMQEMEVPSRISPGNRDGGDGRTLLSILLLETPTRECRCDVETRLLCAVPSSVSFSLGPDESYHSDNDSDRESKCVTIQRCFPSFLLRLPRNPEQGLANVDRELPFLYPVAPASSSTVRVHDSDL